MQPDPSLAKRQLNEYGYEFQAVNKNEFGVYTGDPEKNS